MALHAVSIIRSREAAREHVTPRIAKFHETILQSYFILAFALYTAEASLRAAVVGTTPSSPLQRLAKQSHGSLGFELYAYAGGSGGVLNI